MPDDLHRRLRIRAAQQQRSMSDLALGALVDSLDRPTRAELFERIASRAPTSTERPAAEHIRDEPDRQ